MCFDAKRGWRPSTAGLVMVQWIRVQPPEGGGVDDMRQAKPAILLFQHNPSIKPAQAKSAVGEALVAGLTTMPTRHHVNAGPTPHVRLVAARMLRAASQLQADKQGYQGRQHERAQAPLPVAGTSHAAECRCSLHSSPAVPRPTQSPTNVTSMRSSSERICRRGHGICSRLGPSGKLAESSTQYSKGSVTCAKSHE